MADKRSEDQLDPAVRPMISNGPGASDDSSGGGNASGNPDADTAMREGSSPPEGDPAGPQETFPRKVRLEQSHPGTGETASSLRGNLETTWLRRNYGAG